MMDEKRLSAKILVMMVIVVAMANAMMNEKRLSAMQVQQMMSGCPS